MIDKKEHLPKELLYHFIHGKLDDNDYLEVLEHIASCDYCTVMYADSIEEKDIIPPPHYLKTKIMAQIHKENTVVTFIHKKNSSIKQQLFLYSLKVGLAACVTLFLIFSGMFQKDYTIEAKKTPDFQRNTIDDVNDSLYDFSNKIINMEGNYYDQEKK